MITFALPAAPADAGTFCPAETQNIKHLKNISCERARKVAKKARRALVFEVPDCAGDPIRYWNGWKLKGRSSTDIETRFTKGSRGFTLYGGGTC